MGYPVVERASPREARRLRREWIAAFKARGMQYPRLADVGFVELDKIELPIWAEAKAVKGLTVTRKSIWLRRILARELMREDQEAGGNPKVTWSVCRKCKICRRMLLGLEAEHRFDLDRKWEGFRIPCSPECVELERIRLESPKKRKQKGHRHAPAGN